MTGMAFDTLAARYDALWSETSVGFSQRKAVWQWTDALFRRDQRVLDLGCGTGADAVHLMARGVRVQAIDASGEMARVAAARGIDARQLAIEDLSTLEGRFDGALSNFGALNCVPHLEPVAQELGRLVRPGGYLAICVIGRTCAWEVFHYLRRGKPAKAFRRWNPRGATSSIGVHVAYPSVRQIVRAFRGQFQLVSWCGVGLFVPPSYVQSFSDAAVARFLSLDRKLAHLPVTRSLADHRLLVFKRI